MPGEGRHHGRLASLHLLGRSAGRQVLVRAEDEEPHSDDSNDAEQDSDQIGYGLRQLFHFFFPSLSFLVAPGGGYPARRIIRPILVTLVRSPSCTWLHLPA